MGCFVHDGPRFLESKRDMTKVFREFGLPKTILSDNGIPFANKGVDGISRLNVWWTELGIRHARTEPASPQQNANHERMHREMERDIRRAIGKNSTEQQKLLNVFQSDYNSRLKHGGLDDATPDEVYIASNREFPEKIVPPEYPDHFDIRLVSKNGGIKWYDARIPISTALYQKYIGLEEVDTGLYKIWFYNRFLGYLDEKVSRLEDEPGRYRRAEL